MDMVEKLRRINGLVVIEDEDTNYDYEIAWQAADEIERLRKALTEIYLTSLNEPKLMVSIAFDALKQKDLYNATS